MSRLMLAAAVALWLAGCGDELETEGPTGVVVRDSAGVEIVESYTPLWSAGEGWRVGTEPLFVLRGSDGTEENRLLDPTSIDVDSQGRIIVGDGNQAGWHAVLVYDSAGHFQFQAGRSGQGPGEFGQLWWASAYRGDSIAAFDMSGDKLSVFAPDGEFARGLRTPPLPGQDRPPGTMGFTAGADAAYGDGHFLAYPRGHLDISEGVGPAWYKHLLLRLNPSGESWDTLGSFEIMEQYWSGTQQEQYWFGGVAVSAVGSDVLYFGKGKTFEVGVHDGSGRLIRLIRRSYDPRAVTEELRGLLGDWYVDFVSTSPEVNEERLAQIRLDFDAGRFAETLPAYSQVLLDDLGNLWVEEFRWVVPNERSPIQTPTQWSVFNPRGAWLGNVETPTGLILHRVSHDRVLGFMIDEMGVKEVYVYPLER